LKQLLKEFLDGAGRNDLAVHERFWADELIYTRSAGQRLSKGDIFRDTKAEAPRPRNLTKVSPRTAPKTSAFCNTATLRSSLFVWSPPSKKRARPK
jgi:hypothetical protein